MQKELEKIFSRQNFANYLLRIQNSIIDSFRAFGAIISRIKPHASFTRLHEVDSRMSEHNPRSSISINLTYFFPNGYLVANPSFTPSLSLPN